MNMTKKSNWLAICPVFAVVFAGCGDPVTTAVKIGVHVVGKVVEDAETEKVGEQLLGRHASEADAVLGETIDVYSEQGSSRQWRVYPVPMDVLKSKRYVVEVVSNRIVFVEMVTVDSSKVDIPLALIYKEKLKGKTPAECEADLDMGLPVMSLKSRATGQLTQMYDARLIKELPKPHYCVVRFDASSRCEAVKFAEIAAEAGTQE